MFRRKCKLILVRHGATIYNEQNRLFDCDDYPPINQNGKIQIENLSKWLLQQTTHVDKIYTSTALRAIQSTRIISKAYDLDYETIVGLYERKAGLWGGLTFEQIENQYPDMLHLYHENPYEYWPDGGESTLDLRERVNNVINNIIAENEYKTVIIVTHEGVIQSVIAYILGIPPENQGKILIPTGSATQINFYSNWATLAYCSHVTQ